MFRLFAKWVIGSAISDYICKTNYIYVQKVAFLDNFENFFEKFQSVAKLCYYYFIVFGSSLMVALTVTDNDEINAKHRP